MIVCSGCQRQQPGTDTLCLACIEDLSVWLRQIPDLYAELAHVRLPGSVRTAGPQTGKLSGSAPAAPIRLEVFDLHDRGVVFSKLEVWAGQGGDVRDMCDRLRHGLLSVPLWEPHDAGDYYRTIKALCRELGRAVGEPQELPVGKCARPDAEGFQCRGHLMRTQDGRAVYCRRCGDKPELHEQQVWVTLQQAAQVSGVPIETVRTWYKRGRVGWSPPLRAGMCWLPIVVRRAADRRSTTLQHSSDNVNHGSGAELSAKLLDRETGSTLADSGVSDTDVLGRVAPGNVTPSVDASAGTDDASDPVDGAPEQGPQYPASDGEPGPSTAAPSPQSAPDRGDRVRAGEETPREAPIGSPAETLPPVAPARGVSP